MARPKKKTTSVSHLLIPEEPKTEWQKALAHFEENIKLYAAGLVFVIICIAIGALIRVNAVMKDREITTLYAEAALEEDAAARLELYEAFSDDAGRWTPEVLYMMGETAIEAGELDTARSAFERVVAEYPNSDFVPNATHGLAFLEWNTGSPEAALEKYEELVNRWPGEYIARRSHYTIGQLLEELDRPEDAVAAYRRQLAVFPDSAVAARAEQALDRMEGVYPELFPDPSPADIAPDADPGEITDAPDAAMTDYLNSETPRHTVDPQGLPEIE